jgi:hypothetical protein
MVPQRVTTREDPLIAYRGVRNIRGHLQSNLHAAGQNEGGGLLLRGIPIVSHVITYGVTL